NSQRTEKNGGNYKRKPDAFSMKSYRRTEIETCTERLLVMTSRGTSFPSVCRRCGDMMAPAERLGNDQTSSRDAWDDLKIRAPAPIRPKGIQKVITLIKRRSSRK